VIQLLVNALRALLFVPMAGESTEKTDALEECCHVGGGKVIPEGRFFCGLKGCSSRRPYSVKHIKRPFFQ
jgi:hypothetical protein